MQEQHHAPKLDAGRSLNPPVNSRAAEAAELPPAQNARVESYLDAVCATLKNDMAGEVIAERRAEMRGHLLAAIAALQELGNAPDEAVTAALEQFGPPHLVRHRWQQVIAETAPSVWPTLKLATCVWGVAFIALLAVGQWIRTTQVIAVPLMMRLTAFMVFDLALLAGLIVGLFGRRRTLLCNAAGMLLALPAYLSVTALQLHAIQDSGWGQAFWFAINPVMVWIPLSSLAAGAGTLIQKAVRRSRRALR